MFTVVDRRAISDELTLAATEWLMRHGLPEEVDGSWLELVCEDGDVFRPDELMLHLAVAPCEVSPGDSVDVGRTQTVGRLWPQPGAPAGEVPKELALARTFERRDDQWVGVCELPGPVRELFTVEQPQAMLSVMNATRRTLGLGAMSVSGDPKGQLTFTLVAGDIAVWGSTEAHVPEAFVYWLDAGPAMALATPLQGATHVVGSLGALYDLIITNDRDVEARCALEDAGPTPELLPQDYFENHAQGQVEGIRIERTGGLGREALAAIASLRPHDVTLEVSADGELVIGPGTEGAAPFKLGGDGIATHDDRHSRPIVVPYMVALAIHDGAAGGIVNLAVDDRWGRVHRADQGITVQWAR